MQNTAAKLSKLPDFLAGHPLDSADIILCQRRLKLNNRPSVPADYAAFLHFFNSFSYEGCHLFGISPQRESEFDLLSENALINVPHPEKQLILGFNEMDYLLWDALAQNYQTVDKNTFEVLNTIPSCETAILDFFGIND